MLVKKVKKFHRLPNQQKKFENLMKFAVQSNSVNKSFNHSNLPLAFQSFGNQSIEESQDDPSREFFNRRNMKIKSQLMASPQAMLESDNTQKIIYKPSRIIIEEVDTCNNDPTFII